MFSTRFKRAAAALFVAVWTCGLALPAFGLAHTFDVEDLARQETGLGVRQSVAYVNQEPSTSADDHCAVCHLQRAARGAVLAAADCPTSAELPAFERVAPVFALPAGEPDLLPSRGPPALSIS